MALQVKRCTEEIRKTLDIALENGQPLYTTDTHKLFIGDGTTSVKDLVGTNIGLNIENGAGNHSIEHILSTDGTRYNKAEGAYSVVLGQQGIAYGRGSISVGNSTQAGVKDIEEWKTLPNKENADDADMNKYNRYQFVIGASNKALGGHSFAGGGYSTASGLESFAFGYQAKASNDYAISLGYQTSANGTRSIVLGNNSTASGLNAIAIGHGSEAHGDDAIAIGWNSSSYFNKVSGTKSLGIGIGNTVESDNSISLGYHNKITGEKKNIFQLGSNLSSQYENTIALGHYNDDRYVDNANKGILLSVGNGTASARSNAFEVLRDGRARVQSQPVEENDVVRWQEKVELENRIENEENERRSADSRLETLVQDAVSAQEERDAQLQNLLEDEVQRAKSAEAENFSLALDATRVILFNNVTCQPGTSSSDNDSIIFSFNDIPNLSKGWRDTSLYKMQADLDITLTAKEESDWRDLKICLIYNLEDQDVSLKYISGNTDAYDELDPEDISISITYDEDELYIETIKFTFSPLMGFSSVLVTGTSNPQASFNINGVLSGLAGLPEIG